MSFGVTSQIRRRRLLPSNSREGQPATYQPKLSSSMLVQLVLPLYVLLLTYYQEPLGALFLVAKEPPPLLFKDLFAAIFTCQCTLS